MGESYMKQYEKMNITIEGNEKNKNEIIYNNLLDTIDTKDEKIEYLKQRLANIENDNRNRVIGILTILLGVIGLSVSYYFTAINLYPIGILLGFISFFGVLWKVFQLFQTTLKNYKSDKFEQVERLYKLLNSKLK